MSSSHGVEERLPRGQLPLGELPHADSVKDVRSLRVCSCCGGLGNAGSMIDWDNGEFLHGRCFVQRYGIRDLCLLPKGKTDRLTLGDLGIRWMRKLIDYPNRGES